MKDDKMKFPVVIPSASDDAGLANDYFSLGNINLLPLVHKTLIEYLLDDLQKKEISDFLSRIYLIVGEELKKEYENVIKKRKNIDIICQAPYEKRGILTTVNKIAREFDTPFFIIYGDTIMKNGVLKQMLSSALELYHRYKESPWGVIALIGDDPGSLPPTDMERNRWGYVVVDSRRISRIENENGNYGIVDEEGILDIIYRPSYVSLLSKRGNEEFLIESGAMIISPSLWSLLSEHHETDPLGLHSIINSARHSMIKRGFIMKGIIVRREDWLDINYPWEYLKANDYLSQYLRHYKQRNEEDPDLLDSDYAVVASKEELLDLYKESRDVREIVSELSVMEQPIYQFSNEYTENVWGIHEDAKIDGYLAVPDPRRVKDPKIFLGRNSVIKGNCVIKNEARIRSNATIVNSIIGEHVLIGSYALIDHSVIMNGSRILRSSIIPYSIIGQNVVIGGKSMIACERTDPGDVRFSKYYASCDVIKYRGRFGAIVGDEVKMGMNTYVQPGRKIGKGSRVHPGTEIIHTCPPKSIVRSKKIG